MQLFEHVDPVPPAHPVPVLHNPVLVCIICSPLQLYPLAVHSSGVSVSAPLVSSKHVPCPVLHALLQFPLHVVPIVLSAQAPAPLQVLVYIVCPLQVYAPVHPSLVSAAVFAHVVNVPSHSPVVHVPSVHRVSGSSPPAVS